MCQVGSSPSAAASAAAARVWGGVVPHPILDGVRILQARGLVWYGNVLGCRPDSMFLRLHNTQGLAIVAV